MKFYQVVCDVIKAWVWMCGGCFLLFLAAVGVAALVVQPEWLVPVPWVYWAGGAVGLLGLACGFNKL